jgi:hypothetical protein
MAATERAVRKAKGRMKMHARLTIKTFRNIADQAQHLALLVDVYQFEASGVTARAVLAHFVTRRSQLPIDPQAAAAARPR